MKRQSPQNEITSSRGMWIFYFENYYQIILQKNTNLHSTNNVVECLFLHTFSNAYFLLFWGSNHLKEREVVFHCSVSFAFPWDVVIFSRTYCPFVCIICQNSSPLPIFESSYLFLLSCRSFSSIWDPSSDRRFANISFHSADCLFADHAI